MTPILTKLGKLKKNYHCLFIACSLLACPVFLPAANAETDITDIKQALLNDMLFLSQLRDRLSASSMDEDHIRGLVRDYLLENPELILEIQQILNERQELSDKETEQAMAGIITQNTDFLFNNVDDLVIGNKQGDVTLVEFYDYNCGYCKASYPAVLDVLEKDKNVKLIMKDYPILGEDSAKAHIVARAFKKLMPDEYEAFHHKMMTRQGRATWDNTIELALTFGADKEHLLKLTQEESLQAPLVETAKIAYQLGINFTPAYIIGTEILRGAVDQDVILATVEMQREHTKK